MQRFAVLGHPINHSFSPVMHTASFRSIGFDGEYVRLDVPPEMLGDALKALADEGFSGVNLTIPHKMLALPMMDALTPEAQRLGAVNTVRFAQGRMEGHNTDGPGFLAAAKATLGVAPAGPACAVIGCGGAGRAIAITLAHAGAKRIGLLDLDRPRAEALAAELRAPGFAAQAIGRDALRAADFLATADELRAGQALYDIVIPPRHPQTPTMREAAKAGARAANGVRMLVEQGALSFTSWTGLEDDRAAMLRAVEEGVSGHE